MGGMQRYGPTERAVTLWGHEIACLGPFGDMNYIANVLALAIPRNHNVPLTHLNCLFAAGYCAQLRDASSQTATEVP